MDTHLIGIDLAKLLLNQDAQREKQRQIKAAKPAAQSPRVVKETRAEDR
jgi:hypothetical protein